MLKTGSSYVIGGRKTGSGGSGSDIYLVYIGQNGEEQLSRTWGGVKNDSCYALIATADGGVIAAGTKNTTDTNREDLYLAKVPPITPPAPAITELTPGSGYVGSVVTVTGENFGDSEGTVEFNGTVATIQSWSDTQIVTAVPQGASSGTVTVQTGNAVCTGPVFTVNTPFITVTSPNGGEVWQAGDSRTITWNSSPGISHVKIEFSTAGFAGTYVAAHSGESIPNTGSYSWTVADADSGQCAIRIWDIAGILSAGSAAVFTIQPAPSILVDSPVDGDNWESGRSHTVNWTASGISGDVTIDLYKGMSYYNIRVTAPADSGAMSLHIPSGFINGTDYRVRIYQGAVEGYSGYFSITGKPNYVFHGNDYNGDQKSDIAFFRPAGGRWYIEGSPSVAWGTAADIPVPGDYNGDGTTDIAIFRPSTGRWCIMGQASISWGTATDIPMPADYNGDGSTDIAIFRSSMGKWCIMGQPSISWGTSSDIPVPADYDGDGDTDIAVFRPSTGRWCIMGQPSIPMGISTDIPIPADFDGDGDADIAIYRPSIGTWFIQGSPSIVFGDSTDIPLISHNGR
ncbi:MAG: hypothetical protein GY765_06200 [bacterium]|nr:hypothetical protein [bacterium]